MAVKDEVMARVRSIPDNSSNILDRTGPLAWTAGIMNYIQRYNVTGEELLSELREAFRLDDPYPVQLGRYLLVGSSDS